MNNTYYVYEWYNVLTKEVFYVGKGCGKRYSDLYHRNQLFLDYISNNQVDVRIIKEFEIEEEAYDYEAELIDYYKSIGQCQCCLQKGGYGGYSNVWNQELRDYWSKYNPMKREDQRQRMRKNNPMKNKEIAMKNGAKHKKAVIINGIRYDGVTDAATALKVSGSAISFWCKQGGNKDGWKCRYEDEEQKEYKYTHPGQKSIVIDGQIFSSIKEGAQAFNLEYTSLAKALQKGKNPYKGHICNYVDQQPSQ